MHRNNPRTHEPIRQYDSRVDSATLENYLAAGWTSTQIIKILFAIAAKEFVYRVQRLAQVPLDEPLANVSCTPP